MDEATIWFLTGKIVSTFSAPAVIVVVGIFLTQVQQGYFYTIYSVLNLAVFFELGLGGVLVYVIGHDSGSVEWARSGIRAPLERLMWLGQLFRKILTWYGLMAAAFVVSAFPAGYYLLSSHHGLPSSEYISPLIIFLLAFAGGIFLGGPAALIEGTGRIPQVRRTQFIQSLSGSAALIVALVLHFGLWAVAFDQTAATLVLAIWLLSYRRQLLGLARTPQAKRRFRWRADVLPLQWRVALSWLAGYFINMGFVPILFAFRGPIEAGQMGMTLRLSSALYVVSIGLTTTKAAKLSALAASDQPTFLREMRHNAYVSVGLGIVGVAGFSILMLFLQRWWPSFPKRLLPFWATIAMLTVSVLGAGMNMLQVFARAQKQDPFVWANLITAACVFTMSLIAAAFGRATTVAYGYLAVSLFIGVPVQLLFLRYWRR